MSPTNLPKTQAFCLAKATHVVVVCKNNNIMLTSFLVVAPSFKRFNNNKQLIIMGLVLSLY